MSKLSGYTVAIEKNMRVRHDTQARFTVKSGRRVLEDRLTPVDTLGGAMTLAGFTYNRLTMSGGVDWWDPKTGKSLGGAPQVQMRVRRQDVLTGDQECGCDWCMAVAA